MPGITKVSDIMNKDIYSVNLDSTLKEADDLIKTENIKRIPVLDNKKFVGLITDRKVMEYTLRGVYDPESNYGEEGFNKIMDFENLLVKKPHVIYPEDSVQKAIKMMAKYHLECIPVVDWEMNLLGIITFTDLLLFIHKKIEEGEFDN